MNWHSGTSSPNSGSQLSQGVAIDLESHEEGIDALCFKKN